MDIALANLLRPFGDHDIIEHKWDDYNMIVKDRCKVNPHVESLFSEVPAGVAYDLGCGVGQDTQFLLSRNWKVYAMDISEVAIRELRSKLAPCPLSALAANVDFSRDLTHVYSSPLSVSIKSLEEYTFVAKADLILANDILGFCTPSKIIDIWNQIYQALKEEGTLICTLPTSKESRANFYLKPQHITQHLVQDKYKVIQKIRLPGRIHDLCLILQKISLNRSNNC
jgi:SAM-dependent methyltransferase